MAGTGAPKGNQYAKKDQAGRTIGLYITSDEWGKLHEVLLAKGEEATDKAISQYARQLFKDAVKEIGGE